MTCRTRWFLAAATTLAAVLMAFPRAAEARGRVGFRGAIVVPGFFGWPHYAYGPYFGFGPYWGPYYGPYAPGGFDPGMAAAAGIGAVDLNVKPGEAEVWVDGRFMAEARDLDGSPRPLWLREGPHHIVIYKGGYRSFDEEVSVAPGQRMNLKVHLEKGDSPPPGLRPGAKANHAD
jgi:hypothetical protein